MFERNLYLVTYRRSNTDSINVIGGTINDAMVNFWKYIDGRNDFHSGVGTDVLEVKLVGRVAVQLAPGI
jgi:hypothetical protein